MWLDSLQVHIYASTLNRTDQWYFWSHFLHKLNQRSLEAHVLSFGLTLIKDSGILLSRTEEILIVCDFFCILFQRACFPFLVYLVLFLWLEYRSVLRIWVMSGLHSKFSVSINLHLISHESGSEGRFTYLLSCWLSH